MSRAGCVTPLSLTCFLSFYFGIKAWGLLVGAGGAFRLSHANSVFACFSYSCQFAEPPDLTRRAEERSPPLSTADKTILVPFCIWRLFSSERMRNRFFACVLSIPPGPPFSLEAVPEKLLLSIRGKGDWLQHVFPFLVYFPLLPTPFFQGGLAVLFSAASPGSLLCSERGIPSPGVAALFLVSPRGFLSRLTLCSSTCPQVVCFPKGKARTIWKINYSRDSF